MNILDSAEELSTLSVDTGRLALGAGGSSLNMFEFSTMGICESLLEAALSSIGEEFGTINDGMFDADELAACESALTFFDISNLMNFDSASKEALSMIERKKDADGGTAGTTWDLIRGTKWFWLTRAICSVLRSAFNAPRGNTSPLPSHVRSTHTT